MIRRAVPADAAPLAMLLRALNDEPGLRTDLITAEPVMQDLIDDPRALVLVAVPEQAVMGFATAHPTYDSGTSQWGFFFNDLFVACDFRRRGIARALVAATAAQARRDGGAFLWWNADEGDTLALSFHRSLEAGVRVIDFTLAGAAFAKLADAA